MTYNKKVIYFPVKVEEWSFWDFVFSSDSNPVEEWRAALSDEGKLYFNSVLKNIRNIENPIHWTPLKRFLKGKYAKYRIWELEFKADGRQYRVLGNFGKERKQAVLLAGCYHKTRVYTPPDALDSAFNRARLLTEGRAKFRERKIRTDI